jgi:hypothetical protein
VRATSNANSIIVGEVVREVVHTRVDLDPDVGEELSRTLEYVKRTRFAPVSQRLAGSGISWTAPRPARRFHKRDPELRKIDTVARHRGRHSIHQQIDALRRPGLCRVS